MQDFFEMFGLKSGYALDAGALDRAYRDIQARIHPDRFAQAGDAERRAAMQWSTRVNEGYRTLKDPLARARYILELHGVDAGLETNTAMPAEFLMQQMQWREQLEAAAQARDAAALDRLERDLAAHGQALHAELAESIDQRGDYAGAAARVRSLMFLKRLDGEIRDAHEALEA